MEPVCSSCYSSACQGHHKKAEDGKKRAHEDTMGQLFANTARKMHRLEGNFNDVDGVKENIGDKRLNGVEVWALDDDAKPKRSRCQEKDSDEELADTDINRDQVEMELDGLEDMFANIKLVHTNTVLDPIYSCGGMTVYQKSIALELAPSESHVMYDKDFIQIGTTCEDYAHLIVHQGRYISDEGMRAVLQHKWKHGQCQLYKISIGSLPNVTDDTLFVIGDYFPELRELHINGNLCPSHSPRITSEGVEAVARCCQNLKIVNLNWCRGISNRALYALGKYCPNLKEFSVYSNLEVTLEGFQALLNGCQQLECIDICDCTQVTDEWLSCFINSNCNIKKLDVRGCFKLSNEALQAIRDQFPDIELSADIHDRITIISSD